MTSTFVILRVSLSSYLDIKKRLEEADPDRIWTDGRLNLDGVALEAEPQPKLREADSGHE